MQVAFIGLGIMGSRMARHILEAGHELTVWNRSPGPGKTLEAAGARLADDPIAAVADAQIVLTMLSTEEVVEAVMLSGGVLDAMRPRAIWADASTVGPQFALRSEEWAVARALRYLGAPVAGTREPAQAGTLKVLIGGPASTLQEARPVLEAYSAGILHVGEAADRGAILKILINGMLAQSMAVFSETVKLGEALGLDTDFLLTQLSQLPVIASFVGSKTGMMRTADYGDASFPLELMHKDLNLVVQAGYAIDQPVLLASVVRELYGRARKEGRGRDDMAAVHALDRPATAR